MEETERAPAFEKFIESTNRLLADDSFREVLRELEAEGEKVVGTIARDPAGFLESRGVELPDHFRVSLEQYAESAVKGTTTTRYCLRICAWHWCIEICISKTTTRSVT
jgi:hypothetical protein